MGVGVHAIFFFLWGIVATKGSTAQVGNLALLKKAQKGYSGGHCAFDWRESIIHKPYLPRFALICFDCTIKPQNVPQ